METIERDLFRLIYLAAEFMSVRKCFDDQAVSQAEINVITGIDLHAPCSLKELADALQVSSSACSQHIERLVQRKLVERVTDVNDRRGVKLDLTGSGHQVISAYRQCRSSIVDDLAVKLNGQDKTVVAGIIQAIADTLDDKIREFH